MKTFEQLYSVYSTVSEFQFAGRDYYGVRVDWFVAGREESIVWSKPYEQMADYHLEPADEGMFLDEHFTFPEALALSNYLFEVTAFESQIVVSKLPHCNYFLPTYYLHDLDGREGYIKLSELKNYRLPIEVWGYFGLHGPQIWWTKPSKDSKKLIQFDEQNEKINEIITFGASWPHLSIENTENGANLSAVHGEKRWASRT